MNRPQIENNFAVGVNNFGPIVEANIELRPLTVFLGPSNVGKSYLAILIYALHRAFGSKIDTSIRSPYIYRPKLNFIPSNFESIELTPELVKSTHDWLQSSLNSNLLYPMPEKVNSQIESALKHPKFAHVYLINEIKRCLNVAELDDLIRLRQHNSNMRINLVFPQKSASEKVNFEFLLNKHDAACIGTFGDIESAYRALTASNSNASSNLMELLERYSQRWLLQKDSGLRELLAYLSEILFRHMLQPIQKNAYFIPAARTGIMDVHRVVVSALLQGASQGGLRPSAHVPTLPGIMSDFLDQLYNLRDYGRQRSNSRRSTAKLASKIESNILKGGVQLDMQYEHTGPSFSYRPDDWSQDIPFVRVSSMVSELAPIVLYLRYLVNRGDTLIIEEPESHLHPAMQAELALEIARMVRHGIRIIVTTHSEWFLEKIGNLVGLSEIPGNSRYRSQNGNVALYRDEVGAWLFKTHTRPKGSKVEEIQIDPETGIFPTDYDVVGQALYNEGAEIFNRLSDTINEQIG